MAHFSESTIKLFNELIDQLSLQVKSPNFLEQAQVIEQAKRELAIAQSALTSPPPEQTPPPAQIETTPPAPLVG